jgi:hypothetical protein
MRLSPQLLDQHLNLKAQPMAWRRASLCPCRDPHTGGADSDCPNCNGIGTFWAAPRAALAPTTAARAARNFADFGRWEDGDVMLSVPGDSPLWGAGENDRVTLLKGEMPFQVKLAHDSLSRLNFSVARLDRCFWLSPNTRLPIEASLPRVDAQTGVVAWTDLTDAPDPGAQFTLIGVKRPEYFLYRDLPVSRSHFDGLRLPKRMLLRRFDLWATAA